MKSPKGQAKARLTAAEEKRPRQLTQSETILLSAGLCLLLAMCWMWCGVNDPPPTTAKPHIGGLRTAQTTSRQQPEDQNPPAGLFNMTEMKEYHPEPCDRFFSILGLARYGAKGCVACLHAAVRTYFSGPQKPEPNF